MDLLSAGTDDYWLVTQHSHRQGYLDVTSFVPVVGNHP